MATVHKRQRSGSNKWSEPQEFATGYVTLEDYLFRPGTAQLMLRNAADDAYEALRASSMNVTGNMVLSGGGKIVSSSSGNIQLLPDTGGITIIGDDGSTSHSLSSNDDLFVSGQLEVDGSLWTDSPVYTSGRVQISSDIKFLDAGVLEFGSDLDVVFQWNDTAGLLDTTTVDSMALPCVQTGSLATLQTNNTVAFSVDETNDELDITVKYSDGTVKSGAVTLT